MNDKLMKTETNPEPEQDEDMLREYSLDYSQARPNRFAGNIDKSQIVVLLDPDVAEVFTTPESVNAVLRALIKTMPKTQPRSGRKPVLVRRK
jgi:hypothetical protein